MPKVKQVDAYLWRIEHNNQLFWALSATEAGILVLRLVTNQPNA